MTALPWTVDAEYGHAPVVIPAFRDTSVGPGADGSGAASVAVVHATEPAKDDADKKKKRKKEKTRSAWIAFTGRIVAQVVGAVATIFLGVYCVDKYRAPRSSDDVRPVAIRPMEIVSRVRGTAEGVAIAVLPFQNFSGQAREEYAADSTTEALITALAQVSELRIISRTSSMHYKGSTKPLPEIARELEVEWIVEGSVIRSAGGIRVTAQLIDAQHDEHVWARAYDEPPGDILQLHKRIIGAIAAAVAGVVIPRSGGPSPITPSAVAPAAVTPSVSTGERDRGGRAPRAQWHAPEPESRNGTASAGTNSH